MKKIILLATAFTFSIILKAQDSISFNFTFNHMALSVKDVDVSAAFYKNVFQLKEIENRSALAGIRWISLGEKNKELHLISLVKEPVTVNKGVHLALTTQNIDAFAKRLDDLKIEYGDFAGKPHTINIRADGVKQIYFKDPDGYWIEVNNGYDATIPVEKIKNEIWQLEENYWKYVKANDLKSYLSLWDDQFIGYPSTNNIAGKDHIADWVTDIHKNKAGVFNYELTRKVENVFGDIVIVLYDVTHNFIKGSLEETKKGTYKITHTWKKTDKGWLIIGGMGANK
jgi:lactoylglutathione lyase